MPDLKPLSPLGGTAPRIDIIGSATITEVPDVALASIAARRGGLDATLAAIKGLIGADAPGPGQWAGSGPAAALWSGPEQWMAMAPLSTHELLADDLADAASGMASVTEQTGAWVRFDIAGATRIDLLERLCALPVRRMVPGSAARGRIEHLGCFLICRDGAFAVLGPASSAGSLHHALVTAAQSIA